jgi:two-component system, OmpR family, sensor histidine kinase KdpD
MPTEPQETRPDPDALLAQVKADEARQQRGKLKIFFGASAGVGKTYAMLSAGRAKAMEDADVVIGYAEPHARPETEVLLLGMEILPYRMVEYRGTQLKEFDLDAALLRKPELILVDELAHTNAPGCRHAKRWQDVEELLDAGIDVTRPSMSSIWRALTTWWPRSPASWCAKPCPTPCWKRPTRSNWSI